LFKKLCRYTDDHEQIHALLAELSRCNYLSNQRFAENYIAAKGHKYGAVKLKYLLHQQGVESELVNSLYQQAEIDQLELACSQLRRKFTTPPIDLAAKAKYLRFLVQRGFSMGIAQTAVKQAYHATDTK
jgi:regulatory protein